MINNAFKNGIFPLVPGDYTSDDDRGLRPDSFLVLVLLISLMILILLPMTLIKYILVMLMILINCFLIQKNI